MWTNAKFPFLILAILIAACNVKPANLPTAQPSVTPTTLAIKEPVLEDIKWIVFTFNNGVSFKYPQDWLIVSSHKDGVEFSGFPYLSPPNGVIVNVSHLPIEHKAIADPHSRLPNESGEDVLWEKPISIENANGIEFLWGTPATDQTKGKLVAIYYSEQYEIEVILHVPADAIPTESNKFNVFEYMVQSVRIAP